MYVDHGILIKDCAAKTMPDGQQYLRIASRTPAENRQLVDALAAIIDGEVLNDSSPSIVSHVADAANLLTLAGIAASVVAITLAVRGEFAGAAIGLVGAFVFDVIDGPVAKRTSGRTTEQGAFGANLDSLADMVSAGVALGVVVLAYGQFRLIYVPVAVALAAAAALRLSYFNVHGLDESSGTYTGLPTDLAIISFVALMLLDLVLGVGAFRVVLSVGAVALACLMVSPLRIPKFTGRAYLALFVVALVLAVAHLVRVVQ